MLLQSLLGVSDKEIIDDYHRSNQAFPNEGNNNSAAANMAVVKGKLDKRIFSGTNPEAMRQTLTFLRQQYGSIVPGYTDAIGFDAPWRERFQNAMKLTTAATAEVDGTTTAATTSSPTMTCPPSRL